MTTLRETAFNTFFDYHVDTLKLESDEFIQGYQKNLKEITDKYGGIDWLAMDAEQTGAILADVGKNAIGFGLEKIGETIKSSLGLAGAGVASGNPVQGGIVALAGGLFDLAFDGLADWLEVDPNVELRPGDWCLLDETTNFRRLMGGDMLDPVELEELASETPHSVGAQARLCLNIRTDGVEREVLDVQSGHTRYVPNSYVRRVDTAHQQQLNDNGVLHAIKEMVEQKKESPVLSYDQLDLPVNNRVGDKVNYQGELWEIASKGREGQTTITSNGQFREVNWTDLGPASNQTSARPIDDGMGSFVSDAQGVSVGEWVYVHYPDYGEYHLGVAQKVDGIDVYVVSGDRRDDPKWEKADKLEKWLRQPANNQLGRFRDAVIRRRNDLITQYRPDVDYSSVVFVRERKAASYFQSKVTSSFARPKPSDPLYGKVASVPVADKVYEAEAYQETGALRMRGGGYSRHGGELGEPEYERFPEESYTPGDSGSSTKMLIGAACLAGVLIYIYK